MPATVFIALGSNLGDREGLLLTAVQYLIDEAGPVTKVSRFYETEPLLAPGDTNTISHPLYLNAVIELETYLKPEVLLSVTQSIEVTLGRVRHPRIAEGKQEEWTARTVDIDILSYGNLCVTSDELVLPHPEMHLRDFVLIPLQEIAPAYRHLVLGATVQELITGLRRRFVTGKSLPSRIPERAYPRQGIVRVEPISANDSSNRRSVNSVS